VVSSPPPPARWQLAAKAKRRIAGFQRKYTQLSSLRDFGRRGAKGRRAASFMPDGRHIRTSNRASRGDNYYALLTGWSMRYRRLARG
jgi:hypothetical protein